MSKYILGLNIGNHDSAAALIKDGRLINFIEQERISRHKMAIGEPPIEAIHECLKIEGIQFKDIDAIAVGMDWQYRNKVYKMSEEEAAKYYNYQFEPHGALEDCKATLFVLKKLQGIED